MLNIIHASFANANDGVDAAESLLSHGLRAEEISLILPQSRVHDDAPSTAMLTLDSHASRAGDANAGVPFPPVLPRPPMYSMPHDYGHEAIMAPGAAGYTYDALGAVIPDRPENKKETTRSSRSNGSVLGTEEGAGVGLGLGLLTAMCVPGIGMVAGAGTLVAGLMAAGATVGGISGGIYGWLIGRGLSHHTARAIDHHLDSGRTTLSVTTSTKVKKTEIEEVIRKFNGRLIEQSL